MYYFEFAELTEKERYKMMIGSVIPRPVGLVSSQSEKGIVNIAPFSFYSIASYDPPTLLFSYIRQDGKLKDTGRNILATKEAVVHVVDEENMHMANMASAPLGPGESELEISGFTLTDSKLIRVPGLLESKIRFETRLQAIHTIKNASNIPTSDVYFLEILAIHLAEEVYQDTYILPEILKPISRLAGHDYAALGRITTVERPQA